MRQTPTIPKRYVFPSLLMIAALAACSDKPGPAATTPVSASAPATVKLAASKESLMQAVFGAQYRAASKDALSDLPVFEQPGKKQTMVVKALATSRLPNGDTVLVAGADIPLKPGQDEPNYNDVSTLVSVYLLRETAGKWVVVKRHESLLYRGYGDRPGSVLFPMLGKDRPGLAIVQASTDEGCSDESLHLYDLSEDRPHDLAGIATLSTINKGCGGREGFMAESTTSVWQLAPSRNAAAVYHDLVFAFSEKATFYPPTDEDPPASARPPVIKKHSVRYAYDGKRYKLVSGKNPLMQQ